MATHQTQNANQAKEAAQKPRTAGPVSQEPVAQTLQAAPLVLERAVANPRAVSPRDILALQRAYGNRAVTRLLQTKLMVGPAGDKYEREADRVAEQVMATQPSAVSSQPSAFSLQPSVVSRQPEEEEEVQTKPLAASITPLVQRQAEEEEIQTRPLLQRQGEEEELQTRPVVGTAGGEPDGSFEQRLDTQRGSGSPLPEEVRAYMEPRFGADFGDVRVHTGGEAEQLSRELNAQAFTHGRDIYLGAGKYGPGSEAGQRLLAHELTHVIQQTGSRGRPPIQAGALVQRAMRDAIVTDVAHLHKRRIAAGVEIDESRRGWEGDKLRKGHRIKADPEQKDRTQRWVKAQADMYEGYIREEKVGYLPVARNEDFLPDLSRVTDTAHLHAADAGGNALEDAPFGPRLTKRTQIRISEKDYLTAQWLIARTTDDKYTGYIRKSKVFLVAPEPGLTKKTGGTGALKPGACLYSDAGLTRVSGFQVDAGDTSCSILGDYGSSYLVSAQSVEQGKVTVWVRKTDMASVTDPKRIELQPNLQYASTNAPLFPRDPSKDDVRQGGIGDCYFLAALLTIVDKHPQKIRGMMKDNRDGTVKVRLYDVVPGPPKRFKERYIGIKKSTVTEVSSGKEAFARGSLWVQLLEKAHAAAGYTGLGTARVGAKPSYGEIACGFVSVALEHLLGREAEFSMEAMQTGVGVSPALLPTGIAHLPWSETEKIAYDTAKVASDKIKSYSGLVSHQILKDVGKVDDWMTFVNKVDIEKEVRVSASKGATKYRKAEIRLEDFQQLFTAKKVSTDIAKAVLGWLEEKKLYPGKRGTGKYTGRQLTLFQKIRGDLKAGKYVVVSSKAEVARAATGKGLSAGEPVAKGLAGGHSYAVLGVFPDKDTADLAPGELVNVRLRNPWGQYGRKYFWSGVKLKAKETTKGEFWLELSDLTKRFAWIESVPGR